MTEIAFILAAIPEANVVLNAIVVLALIIFGPKYFRAKNAEAQLSEKDQIIKTHQQTIDAFKDRSDSREADVEYLRGKVLAIEEAYSEAQSKIEGWKGRYEEQSKYTAPEAFEQIEHLIDAFHTQSVGRSEQYVKTLQDVLEHQDTEAERRHQEVLEILRTLGTNQHG